MGPELRHTAAAALWWQTWILLLVLVIGDVRGIADKPPRFLVEPTSRVVKQNAEVRLMCHVEPPTADIRWRRDGEPLDPTKVKDMEMLPGGTLVIGSFRHRPKESSHTGVYQCVASTRAGTVVSRQASLERASIGHFEEGLSDVYVNATEGNVALVPCLPPHGNPAPVTSFELNGTLLQPSTDRHMLLPSGNLQVAKVRQSDQGTYQCIATNPVTGLQRRAPNRVHLKVIAPTVNSPSKIVKSPQTPVEVIKGGNLTLECVAEGSPVPVVTWEKYGGQLPEGRYTQKLGNLVVHNVELMDQGTYICRAGNSGRTDVFRHTVVDVLEPPLIRVPPRDKIVKQGSAVTLHCEPQTNDRVRTDARWLHNGQTVLLDRTIQITETMLTIRNVQMRHAGMYQCLVQNKLGMTYASAWVQVRHQSDNITTTDHGTNQMQDIAPDSVHTRSRPVLEVPPSNMTVVSGASIALPCTPQTPTPDMEIVWHKDAKPIIPRQTFAQLTRASGVSDEASTVGGANPTPGTAGSPGSSRYKIAASGSLQIFNVRPEDAGQFACFLTNRDGTATATAYLTVPGPLPTSHSGGLGSRLPSPGVTPTGAPSAVLPTPPAGPDPSGDGDGGEGEEVAAAGGERGRGRGRGRGGRRRMGKKRNGKKKKKKEETTREDGDVILVPPSKPEVSKLSDTSVLLKWRVPNNNGLPITFFKVQYKNLNPRDARSKGWRTLDEDIDSANRKHEVLGLHPGATYRFRVVAVYSNDDNKQGPNSARFKLAVESEPRSHPPAERPYIVNARPLSPTEINIRWQYLETAQSLLEGFKVSYKKYGDPGEFRAEMIQLPKRRTHKITGLQPNTEYSLKMQAYNGAGFSDYGNIVVKRTLALSDMRGMQTGYPGGVSPGSIDKVYVGVVATTSDVTMYVPNPINTHSSSELLYTVLGAVLGGMLLILVIFMALCAWRQRQQRQMEAARNENLRKFDDPAKNIYMDSIRKKYGYTGGFLLNGIPSNMTNGHGPQPAAPVTNGHIPNYTPDGQTESDTLNGSKINISVNPLTAALDSREDNTLQAEDPARAFDYYDSEIDGSDSNSYRGQSLSELRGSPCRTPPCQPFTYGEITYGSVDPTPPNRQPSGELPSPPEFCTSTPHHPHHPHRGPGDQEEEEQEPREDDRLYDPPDYSSLQRMSPELGPRRPPHRTASFDQSSLARRSRGHGPPSGEDADVVMVTRRQSHEHIPLTNMAAVSSFSRAHDPRDSPARSSGDRSDAGGEDGMNVTSRPSMGKHPHQPQQQFQQQHPHQPQRRRRRRPRDQETRCTATNTDISRNDANHEHPRYNTLPHQPRNVPRWDPPARCARTPSPAPSPSLDCGGVARSDHTPLGFDPTPSFNSPLLAYTDLPRVHDYPPSPDEDDGEGN